MKCAGVCTFQLEVFVERLKIALRDIGTRVRGQMSTSCMPDAVVIVVRIPNNCVGIRGEPLRVEHLG